MQKNDILKNGIKKLTERKRDAILTIGLTVCIPLLLLLAGVQAKRFADKEREVEKIESQQYEVIEANKRLVTGISILSNPQRIENLAVDKLDMKEADADDIVRVQLKNK